MKNTIVYLFLFLCLAVLPSFQAKKTDENEKQVMIVYVQSSSKLLKVHLSIDGKKYEVVELKRQDRRDFNELITFLKGLYADGWSLTHTHMASGDTYEEIYYMLEK